VTLLGSAVLGLSGIAVVVAQTYPGGGYTPAAPPGYRGAPLVPDDDDDLVPLPAPGPYGRPSGTPNPYDVQPQRPPGAIQRDALPAPGTAAPRPPYGGQYQEGAAVPGPGGRSFSYGPWEPVRPPGDVYGPNDRVLPPGPAGRPYDYGTNRGPVEVAPGQPGGYAALPPDYQPEAGKPKELPPQFRRQMVDYLTREPAGTIIIDTPNTYLYLVLGGGKAMRYGIGVGREGFTWAGRERISKMSEWPDWHPPKEMIDRQPYLPRFMAGGESNPLGARALYLGNTLYRIHGTNQPSTIGSFVSSGCIRLVNGDIEDLYGRVQVGTKVVVLPGKQPPETTASVK
jgi:lipoprotein-anchoring transpeptidase ErfK/SrfK